MSTKTASFLASRWAENARLSDRVAPILEEIRNNARDTEKAGRVPTRNIELLREAGYFDIVKPARFGGRQGSFTELVDANIEVSAACASTGWVAGLLSAHQWLVAMFDERVQQEVWESNPNALICGSYAPVRMAERVDGGFHLSGDWAFASGCENADWALCAAVIPARNEGDRSGPAFLLVPSGDYTIAETWDVVGLAGTGSKSLILKDAFVPEHRILSFSDATSGKTPGGSGYKGVGLFNIPLLMGIPFCLGSTAIGAAKGALTSYLDQMGNRVTRGAVAGGNNRVAEFPTIQLRVAEASALVDAAREIVLRDVARAQELAQASEDGKGEITEENRLLARRSQAFAVTLALRAVEALNASTGGLGLQMSNPVQRAWRDANAVGRHISMNWDTVGTMIGQHLLGLAPKGQY
ncbi:flavin-dependent monooxygenase [Rhizobium rhizogenes]|uniref:FMNH2-dependent monooxygenase protein n=1 Tax=Rhizobium rhizogenes (strain K84 / ATCC BAA-868) TaxID=311403 RepID=B9JM10_RHIR8|nr:MULTISPECIES: flavin-dependent monooxygenase [Rhizobium]ACM28724.1 FMNH2-dependent monooxygenase protein [Rhizobium rhizogenes K84]OCJ19010.1 monooxygenase [Agrobacterium sp. B131/95]EJK88019.1 acyl-CoA dehydrogenase [Rhizobium sp. AP16]NTI24410.1 flavin-dependent monooxygenase [Rhizobium rhizogenes]NTI43716.1 flavin-dependent monooxygenase [Rhizobium rhizogenes]